MSDPIHTLTATQRAQILEDITTMIPAHAYWDYVSHQVTWTNVDGIWSIAWEWARGHIGLVGSNNKWIVHTWDPEWFRVWLFHMGALG